MGKHKHLSSAFKTTRSPDSHAKRLWWKHNWNCLRPRSNTHWRNWIAYFWCHLCHQVFCGATKTAGKWFIKAMDGLCSQQKKVTGHEFCFPEGKKKKRRMKSTSEAINDRRATSVSKPDEAKRSVCATIVLKCKNEFKKRLQMLKSSQYQHLSHIMAYNIVLLLYCSVL